MAAQFKNSSFFYTCKENYFLSILPADPQSRNKDGYKALVKIARTYFSADLYEPIAQYLTEGRYLVKLWSAYLTLEYGSPDSELRESCIEAIESTLSKSAHELSAEQNEFFQAYLQKSLKTA
ncbi:hypothetical protein ACFSJU_00570 [Paradesertivirga mongoliensis]|uniref:Uncharacterized protein n=1 Tax=Paradesertivirga mongoliensis TaxID=2100740 RepID=A0ABW4ZFR6_9SPHI|nr:hypothetical protein [Pedobacter mongoliensis]